MEGKPKIWQRKIIFLSAGMILLGTILSFLKANVFLRGKIYLVLLFFHHISRRYHWLRNFRIFKTSSAIERRNMLSLLTNLLSCSRNSINVACFKQFLGFYFCLWPFWDFDFVISIKQQHVSHQVICMYARMLCPQLFCHYK